MQHLAWKQSNRVCASGVNLAMSASGLILGCFALRGDGGSRCQCGIGVYYFQMNQGLLPEVLSVALSFFVAVDSAPTRLCHLWLCTVLFVEPLPARGAVPWSLFVHAPGSMGGGCARWSRLWCPACAAAARRRACDDGLIFVLVIWEFISNSSANTACPSVFNLVFV
jgi:hypothetical protein